MGDSLSVRLDSLDATTREARWTLVRPAALFSGPDRQTVDGLDFRSTDGARLTVDAAALADGTLHLTTDIVRVPLAHARFAGLNFPRVGALASLNATLTGTRSSPQLSFRLALDSVRVDGQEAPSFDAEGSYVDRKVLVDLRGAYGGRPAFVLTGELPVDLTLDTKPMQQRLIEAPLYVRLVADGAPLSGLAAFAPSLRDVSGGFDADVQVAGTWRDLEPRGLLIAREAAFAVPALGTGFREGLLDLSFAPDSIILHRARLSDERSINDSVSMDGAVVRNGNGWRADVRTIARRLRIIDDPRVAEADVSWTLELRGPLDSLALSGEVSLPNANIYIGRQQRRILALEEEVVATNDEVLRYAPRIERLTVRLGNEVRLRSPEANVQLTGAVDVAGTLGAPDVRGEIQATRGTYRLDLGLLQRTFQVDSGRVRMNGPLSVPATLDIHTAYTVRQAERDDVRIGARLTGTVDQPRLTLSSGDLGTTASETEIISYLLFGAPSFVLDGESASAVRLATAALVPSLGGAAERALGARIPFLSELQVTTVAGDSPRDFTLNSFEGLLNSFALTAGTQIGTDSYLRVSGGVCRGENRAAQSLPAWMGVTAEYRPREKLSAELSLTPGGAPCNRVGSWTQIYQFGLDLFRDFRW
jgi:translocation and assembly module TamB